MAAPDDVNWQRATVTSPHINQPVNVIVARNIPYVPNANKLQNLTLYVPDTPDNNHLIGTSPESIPSSSTHSSTTPQWHVHIHGGAWRAPDLDSTSIEAAVTHAFSASPPPITAIASINYTLSPFPTHPQKPYDPWGRRDTSQPEREAQHPQHIQDVLHAFALLRNLGLRDASYILTGHSCGACLAFQATLFPPSHWDARLDDAGDAPPRPAALAGLNGLYDLLDLVYGLGASHAHLKAVYKDLEDIAFGGDEGKWIAASPARVDPVKVGRGVSEGHVPKLVVVDQSAEDQLVPMNEADKMEGVLRDVEGLKVVRGKRCTGVHAAPWEQGYMIWETVLDVLALLRA